MSDCIDCSRGLVSRKAWGRMAPLEREQARSEGLAETGSHGRCIRCKRRHDRIPPPVDRPVISRGELLAELDLIGRGLTIRRSAKRLEQHYGLPWQSFERALLRARRDGDIAA